MIGLIIAIIIFNFIAFKYNKNLTANQTIHIWLFTIMLQQTFDVFVDLKYHGYWYFTKDADFKGLLPHLFLLPPVNMMFLNWFPFKSPITKKIFYIVVFVVSILIYELVTLLPEPWGYFHYGWWKLWYAAIIDPVLLLILLGYYKWICKVEKKI
ncbi:hypothetical protein E2K98_24945 [Bacillus salipaludis]|uniref:Uncharacterized protein n=1 Tax=Bacillus salipaludis TaxID=2547811 RepID=A0A4R5VLL5_9BACI|nr:hypothetical protein [Bacillus salipaludis]TDK58166.1 hypothetical protein E2K98_24945 [Bacillus salipaludis]